MSAPRCAKCGKKSYTKNRAVHAALASSRTFGKGFEFYNCPHNNRMFHLRSSRH